MIFRTISVIICYLLGIIILYLGIVIFAPGFSVPKQPMQKAKQPGKKEIKPPKSRKNVSFKVGEIVLSAWLYLPENLSAPVACIIMNHGFGGTKDMLLESYALRFQEAGMAVLTYDYRNFGTSEGEWTCSECGGIICVHRGYCYQCGERIK
ncbi:hypothetical protein ES705_49522 [subsurface metagenome]